MKCLECGANSAGATGVCARCGAPIGLLEPMEAAWPSTRGPWIDPRNWRVRVVVRIGLGVIAVLALITFIQGRISSRPANQLTSDQLRPGDCLAGSNMGLGKSTPWPDTVTRVGCTVPHEAEVFFAGDIWPQSLAYPGNKPVGDQALARCQAAFAVYDGAGASVSAFTFDYIVPDSSDWTSGDRSLECVAFAPSADGPSGAAPVDYSIKGSKR